MCPSKCDRGWLRVEVVEPSRSDVHVKVTWVYRKVSSIAYTLRYVAPEVIDAKRSGQGDMVVEEALDVWSLGVMAFEMCAGTTPFPRGMPADVVRPPACTCLLYTSPSPRDRTRSRMPSSA